MQASITINAQSVKNDGDKIVLISCTHKVQRETFYPLTT